MVVTATPFTMHETDSIYITSFNVKISGTNAHDVLAKTIELQNKYEMESE